MKITQKQIEMLQAIYKKQTGQILSYNDAVQYGRKIVQLYQKLLLT